MNSKVLIVVPNLSLPGGVSTFWNTLLINLKKSNEYSLKIFEVGGNVRNYLSSIQEQKKFHKQINDNVDLVILNPSLGYRSFIRDGFFSRQLVKKKIPFIIFFHGWNLGFEMKVSKYPRFFLKSFGKAESIFVLSEDFKKKIIEWGYNGDVFIETTTVDSRLLKNFNLDKKIEGLRKSKKIKILFLSRLIREKGVFETVEAFKNLLKSHNNIILTIAGDGKDFEKLKIEINNIDNIKVEGYVEGIHKINLLEDNHIYCLPSYSEGLPISVLEAMAFGMSIITSPVGGLKDFFHEGKMGYFVEPKNVIHIEERINSLLLDKEKIMNMGLYNSKFAKEYFLNDVVARRLDGHIISVLDKN